MKFESTASMASIGIPKNVPGAVKKPGRFLLVLLFIVCSYFTVGQQPPYTKPVYKVAYDKELEPFEFLNKESHPDGISTDILKEVAISANVSFQFLPMTWNEALVALERGQVDLISMVYTPERALLYSISDPYSDISQALFRTEKSPDITDIASLKGHRIGFQENDICLQQFKNRTDFEKVIFQSKLDGLLNVNIGEIDAFFCAQAAGFSIISKYDFKNIDLASGELFNQKYCFATRKGNPYLIELLNRNLRELHSSGRIDVINYKWRTQVAHIPNWIDRHQTLLLFFGIVLGTALVLLLFWNRSLTFRVNRRTKSLQQSEARFAEHYAMLTAILESTTDSIFSLDKNYCYTSYNRVHVSNMKSRYNADIEPGHSLYEYMTVAEDSEKSRSIIDRVLQGEQISIMTYSGSSGRITNYFEISHNPISDATGNIIGVSIFSKDITERTLTENKIKELNKSLEQRVSERTHQLESINRELSFRLNEIEQFTYIASHDLQEPLRSLTSFTQLVHDEYAEKLGGDGDKYIEFIYSSANRMRELVTGLLNYSLLGKEGVKVIVDCNQVVKEVIADMSDLINANKAMITVAELPGLNGFATELRLLFQNLIHNAIKFQRKGICPQINISAVFEKNEWLFSVADNGIGIDDINREKIFIIFKRMHNRDEYEGAGIGLSHCKKIVELHGGQIWVDSNKDAGSIFRFTIPV